MENESAYKLGQLDQFKQDIVARVDKLETTMLNEMNRILIEVKDFTKWRWKITATVSTVWLIFSVFFAVGWELFKFIRGG